MKIKEIANEQERQDAIVKKVTSNKDHRNVLVVTPLNKDRVELNKKIRNKLKDNEILKEPEHTFTVRSPKTLGATNKHFADSYSIGNFVSTNGNIKGLKIGTKGHVISFDNKEHNLTILTSKGNQVRYPRQSRGLVETVNRSKRLNTVSYPKVATLRQTFLTGPAFCPLPPVF